MRRQRGSVLVLVPAGMVIVLLLGAIAVDLSVLVLRQRQASSLAIDVANDLATLALDEPALRATGEFRLDQGRADALASTLVRSSDLGHAVVTVRASVEGTDRVTVTIVVRVDYLFARAIPGATGTATVHARATATAVAG